MGLTWLAPAVAALALASPAQFLQAHQQADGGFAEERGAASPALTAWAALGLVAAGQAPQGALDYLRAHESDVLPPATRSLVALAAAALGDAAPAAKLPTTAGQTNTIAWTILARRQAGLAAPKPLVNALLARQATSGGWGWAKGIAPDSNDTAAVIQALRAAGVSGAPVRRGLAYLRTTRNDDGGFGLGGGRDSDAQSTAWAVQAFVAADARVPKGTFAYLQRLRRSDGSYRYSARFAVTPVWVTAQVLPALLKKPFPFPRR
jgi:energy-coupling factor transport system substrate-specific component